MNYTKSTLLAILQQAEYDLKIWHAWLAHQRDSQQISRLQNLRPERWTFKLKLIAKLSNVYDLFLSTPVAIAKATRTILPFEKTATGFIVWLASLKLRYLQKKGLIVIGVAGSYGKTSVKHLLNYTLSQQRFTLATPASYNTPLGISLTILKRLNADHQIFIAELGEYQIGDLDQLLQWIRPQIGILTPIGFAHSDRFQSNEKMIETFTEMLTSCWSPEQLLVDDANLDLFPQDPRITWYGENPASKIFLRNIQTTRSGSQAQLLLNGQESNVSTRLWGKHQLRNALPGLLLTQKLKENIQGAQISLQYAPDIPRRLALFHNQNGTTVIDNSYNTNPGSWKEMVALLEELQLPHLAVITSGFVELQAETTHLAHAQMADDLGRLAQVVVVVETRDNQDLIEFLQQKECQVLVAHSFSQSLEALQQSLLPVEYLWLEGGHRELYC